MLVVVSDEIRLQSRPMVFYMTTAYSIESLVHYAHATLLVRRRQLGIISWLRHSIWLLLAPALCLLESKFQVFKLKEKISFAATLCMRAIPMYAETRAYSWPMPNDINMAVDFPFCLIAFVVGFLLPSARNCAYCKKIESCSHNLHGWS